MLDSNIMVFQFLHVSHKCGWFGVQKSSYDLEFNPCTCTIIWPFLCWKLHDFSPILHKYETLAHNFLLESGKMFKLYSHVLTTTRKLQLSHIRRRLQNIRYYEKCSFVFIIKCEFDEFNEVCVLHEWYGFWHWSKNPKFIISKLSTWYLY